MTSQAQDPVSAGHVSRVADSNPDGLIIYGGPIRTMARGRPTVEAVGVRGDRIVTVGSRVDVERILTDANGHRPRPFDLEGSLLLPGFVDSHTHLAVFGALLGQIDLDGAATLEEALRRVAHFAASLEPGKWVSGGRWDKNLWGERFPSRQDLDRVVSDRPVALHSKDGHCWWLNSEALRQAGVNRETLDPPGGEIERDPSGAPTGILKENAGTFLWAARQQPSPDEFAPGVAKAIVRANELGLVGICDMEGRDALKVLRGFERAGGLTLRVWTYVPDEQVENLAAVGVESGFGSSLLKIAGVKAFLDGALGSQTADMLAPFEGSQSRGIETMTAEAFNDLVGRASAEGLAVAVHAIGDRACRKALDAFETHRELARTAGLRHRIEHLQLLDPADLPRVGRLGLVASMQPIHAPSDRDIAERYWGPARSALGYAWRSVAETGAVLAFGSDVPVETCDPLHGLFAAVTRRHPADPDREAWRFEQAVTPLQAVRAYTVGAAWSVGEENERGTIEPERLADFVVLSEDILAVSEPPGRATTAAGSRGSPDAAPPDALSAEVADRFGAVVAKTRVRATIVGGRFVYSRG